MGLCPRSEGHEAGVGSLDHSGSGQASPRHGLDGTGARICGDEHCATSFQRVTRERASGHDINEPGRRQRLNGRRKKTGEGPSPARRITLLERYSSAAEQLQDQYDERDHKQDVDERACRGQCHDAK